MIIVDDVILSDDIKEQFFICDLNKCKGACCVEGDAGAPLEQDELLLLEETFEEVRAYLPKKNIEIIDQKGLYEVDSEGDFCTTTVDNRECVFATYETTGILTCAIEKAYNDGKISFKKPISCHLYPIRITKAADKHLLNYSRWDICSPACELGKKNQTPIYKFLKEPLQRKFGSDWYQKLIKEVEE